MITNNERISFLETVGYLTEEKWYGWSYTVAKTILDAKEMAMNYAKVLS